MALAISAAAPLCAQSPSGKSDETFSVPSYIVMNRKFFITLENNNRVQIELTDITDLRRLNNMDSLLQVFVNDIEPLKDSLADAFTSKRIDYITDAGNRKKIRLQQSAQKGTAYFLMQGELSSLRTEQDTVHIIGIITNPPVPQEKISLVHPRYYHLTFYLNDFTEISSFMHGILAEKIKTLQNSVNEKWGSSPGAGFYIKSDKTITAGQPKGFYSGPGDYVNFFATVNVQNYKNYFVPSFSLGAKFVFSNRDRFYKHEFGIQWEPNFIFAKDADNKLQTFRNDFLTFTYGQGPVKDKDPRKEISLQGVASLGYLIRRQGEYFDKNTFRLGAGKLQLTKTSVEPCMYFNNFFKGVTPGIRIIQSF